MEPFLEKRPFLEAHGLPTPPMPPLPLSSRGNDRGGGGNERSGAGALSAQHGASSAQHGGGNERSGAGSSHKRPRNDSDGPLTMPPPPPPRLPSTTRSTPPPPPSRSLAFDGAARFRS
jgi:hypothetical protein